MQEHAVPVGHLVLPVLLPLRQRRLLQQTVCLDNELRSSSLEAYTALDADDGIAHVGVAADGVAGTNLLNLLDGFDAVVELLAVDTDDLTLFELNLQQLFLLLGSDVLQVGLLRQG